MTKLPMSSKSLDKIVRPWFLFGVNVHDTNLVDISNGIEDLFTSLPREIAVKVIEARDKFIDQLEDLLCKEQSKQ